MKKYTLLILTIGSIFIFHQEILGQSKLIELEIVDKFLKLEI